jgi:hypothetical protein
LGAAGGNKMRNMKFGGGQGNMFPGTDVTEKVKQVLKR